MLDKWGAETTLTLYRFAGNDVWNRESKAEY